MNFEMTEKQKQIKAKARDVLDREIAPSADRYDQKGPMKRDDVIRFISMLIPYGYYTGGLAETDGGLGLDYKTQGILLEELSRAWCSLAGVMFIASIELQQMAAAAADIKERFFYKMRDVAYFGCGALTEPNVGSDLKNLETTAVLEEKGFVINGTKVWISNGSFADFANVLAVVVKDDQPQGIARIIVEKDRSPFSVGLLHKLGWRAFPTTELAFNNCRVPAENVFSEAGSGYKQTIVLFELGRSFLAHMSVGIAQAAIDASIEYAKKRHQFGRAIGSFQMIQEMFADMVMETEGSRLLAHRAMDILDHGDRCRRESSLAKAYATEAAVRVVSKALQIHGADGLSEDHPIQRYYRDAKVVPIPDGATEIQKLVVGREMLGIKAFH